jgi:hypothetical protein
MNWKKLFKILKITSKIAYALIIVLLAVALFIVLSGTLVDKTAILDSKRINTIGIMIGLLSIPGIMISFSSLFEKNKKQFKATSVCPHCRHRIDFNLEEE